MEDNILQDISIEEMLKPDLEEDIGNGESAEEQKLPNVYRGKALNETELYQISAQQDINVILVAGLFHSGKTTMEMALYQMFLRGMNSKLQFAGSKTLIDVVERSRGLRVISGNPVPTVARTSKAVEDKYLHISIMDTEQRRHDLIFTDFSGEVFECNNSDDIDSSLKQFKRLRHVLILVDGEKLAGMLKDQALVDCKRVLSLLLQQEIVSDNTIVHIVYSKNDIIAQSPNPNIEKIIENNNDILLEMIGNRKNNFRVHRISAISRDTSIVGNYEGLEELILSCLDSWSDEKKEMKDSDYVYAERVLARRSFDKFAWKG